MELPEAKQKFLQSWGTFGSNWGINKTMAQIHALLLVSPEALSTENVMEALQISRGNANMNLRALMDWGLVEKVSIAGDRKDYFQSEKDILTVAIRVMRERRKRELEPVVNLLKTLKEVEGDGANEKAFREMMEELEEFSTMADNLLDRLSRSERQTFMKLLMRLL